MMPRRALQDALQTISRALRDDQFRMAVLAVAIGMAAAGGEIVFRGWLTAVQLLAFGTGSARLASWAAALPWWQVLLAPAAGGLAIGLFLRYLMPGQTPQGVPHVMEACSLNSGRMSIRAGIGAAIVSASSLGAGASTGREGPVVHLGATIGAKVAEWLRMPPNMSRTLLGCGVAAAVAASFNAPIAGVFFALEVVVGHYALNAFAPIVVASVAATVVSRSYYGDFPAFILPRSYEIASLWEFPAFALLGIVCAVVAMIFMWSVITAERLVGRLRLPVVVRPAIGGLAVGAIAIWFPEVLGVGYETTDKALAEQVPIAMLFALILIKTAATALSLGFSFGGGVFSPSLFVGAMTGGAFGVLATAVFPELSSGQGAYTLVGMGALAGSVLGAPMSSILVLFEMTGDYAVTLALMLAVVFASVLTQAALGKSLFTWQLARRGVSLESGRESSLLRQIRVADVMKHDYARIAPDAGWAEILAKLRDAPYGELFVVEEDDRLAGVITVVELALSTSRPDDAKPPPTAGDLARPNPPVLVADDELGKAIAMIDRINESHIPVVDSPTTWRVVGFVHEHDVMLAYRRALTRAQDRGRD